MPIHSSFIKCPSCRSMNTPRGTMACVDCGYMALDMIPFRVSMEPTSDKLKRCLQYMRKGYSAYKAAKQVGIDPVTAIATWMKYIVLPEWLEMKQAEEQQMLLDGTPQPKPAKSCA